MQYREKSREELMELLESILDIIYEISLEGTILFVSPVVNKIVGYEPEEVIGKNFMDFIYPEDKKWVSESIRTVGTDSNRFLEYRYLTKDNQVKWVRTASKPVYKNGQLVAIRGTMSDIHDRKLAELKIRESEEKYRSLVDSIDAAIMMVDPGGHFLYLNEIACRPYGKQADELLGLRLQDVVLPSSGSFKIEEDLKKVMETNEGMVIEDEIVIVDQKRWFRVSVQPVRGIDGKPVNILLSVTDITQSIRTEEELLKFRTITDQANYGAAIALPDGTLIYCNEIMAEMHGWEIPELIGKNLSVFHNEKQMVRVMAELEKMEKFGGFEIAEVDHTRKDGSTFTTLMNGKVICDAENRPILLSSTSIDISEWKQSERKLRNSEMQLNFAQEIGGMGNWEQSQATGKVTCSRNLFLLLGMDFREDAIPWEEIKSKVYPDDLPIMRSAIIESARSRQAVKVDLRIYGNEGRLLWFENVVLPVYDHEKRIGFRGIIVDINAKKEAEKTIRDLNTNLENRIAERTQELKNTTTELEKFFSVSLDLLCIADNEGHFLKMNKAWENVLGYKVEELENSSFLDLIHPDDLEKTYSAMSHLDAQYPVFSFINRYRTKTGQYRTIEWRATPVGNRNYAAARDITEQVRSKEFESELLQLSAKLTGITVNEIEQALNLALERLGRFLDVERAYIFEIDHLKNCQSNTFEWCKEGITSVMAGLQNQSLDEFPFWNRKIRANEIINIQRVRDLSGEWEIMKQSLTEQGIHSLIAIPVSGPDKQLGFLGLDAVLKPRDFSEPEITTLKVWSSLIANLLIRRQNELLIQQSSEQFATAFHTTSVMMSISRFDEGTYIDINAEFTEVMGYMRDEMIGKTNKELNLFTDQHLRAEILRKLNNRIPVKKIEVQMRTKSGQIKTGLLSADSYYIDGQRYLLISSVDITDRKKAEQEILAARMEAEKANQAKSEFLSRMSHELRTPLNSILGFAQLFEMGDLTPVQSKGVKHIISSGMHLLDLINEVLDISKIEAGKLTLNIEPVKVNAIIREMQDIIEPLADERNILVRLDFTTDDNICVAADRQRLKQILLNFISNAIKYNHEGGLVTIMTWKTETPDNHDKIRIMVKDNGIGISQEDQSKLFMPFERIGAEKSTTEGSGLGLTVVKKLVDAMEGTIGVNSEEGKGSEFWVELSTFQAELNSGGTN